MSNMGIEGWRPTLVKGAGPVYLAIADALASDIRAGVLGPGDRLPPQRLLAERLDIDFTTVSRAYSEARRRGLVEGRVGQGTYVRAGRTVGEARKVASGLVDMAMNIPPQFSDAGLAGRLWDAVDAVGAEGGLELLLRYQEAGGTAAGREAGVAWLADRLPGVAAERLLVCPGSQSALLALVTLLGGDRAPIAVEALTYPGFRSLAGHLRLPLAPVAIDSEGLDPGDFERVCKESKPGILYCTPTLHNPTTATMSLARREAIVAVARRYGVTIIEDDAYGALAGDAIPPLAALAPDIVVHVSTLSKCLAPALRLAFVVVPDARMAGRLAGAVRATASMASPLGAALAARWIGSGLAGEAVAAVRGEAEARRQVAMDILGAHGLVSARNAFHAWLPLPPDWGRGAFVAGLRSAGVGVVASDAFAAGVAPEAVRLGLGAADDRAQLFASLEKIADLLLQSPATASMIV